MIVYVSIGNSDDKLTQAEWSEFNVAVAAMVAGCASTVHGAWQSVPHSRWQNACWCLEFTDPRSIEEARIACAQLATKYQQDSIAWAVAPDTEFLHE